ncbi:MAG: CoA transferase, partial [Chloroflexota bacterium]
AVATGVALFNSGLGGPGQLVEISAQDCLMVEEHQVSRYGQDGHIIGREGNQHGSAAPGAVYAVQDGFAHIFVANTWPQFLDWMGRPEPLTDDAWQQGAFRRANVDLLNPYVRQFAAGFTREQIVQEGQSQRIPVMPVNRPEDVAEDTQLNGIGFFYEGEHSQVGPTRYAGAPYRMEATPPRLYRTAPLLGEHNKEVFTALGVTAAELAVLRANRII